jgi:GTP-binding protein
MDNLPIVAIVGRPNVGKSTLFNRLIGSRKAIVAKEAGTTRDAVTAQVSWDNKPFILIDTAGAIFDFYGFKEADIEQKAQDKLDEAVRAADVVLLVLDAKSGVIPEDIQTANLIRKNAKRVIVVFNKADIEKLEKRVGEVEELGFDESIAISSTSGRRTGDLLDIITRDFRALSTAEPRIKKISIIGRPNAGKSTLFNALCGSDQAIVSEIPGTTRDSVSYKAKFDEGKQAEIIDTAGFRKRGKIEVGIEKFSVMRAIESIYQSDIILLVVDSREGFTRTDAHLAQLAKQNSKELFVVLNKIDLLKDKSILEIKNYDRFGFILKNKIIGVSAKDATNLNLLISELNKAL